MAAQLLHILLFVLVAYKPLLSGATYETEQSGTLTLPSSSSGTLKVYVTFPNSPAGFLNVPNVYSWVRYSGEYFRTQVSDVTLEGFSVQVTRYNGNSGWDGSPTLYWSAQIQDQIIVKTIGSYSSNSYSSRINFSEHYDAPPAVKAWSRAVPPYTFSVSVTSVDTSGFYYNIRRTDSSSGWDQSINLYWTIKEIPLSVIEISQKLGEAPVTATYSIPAPVWATYPTATEIAPNIIDITGREIHLSIAYQLLANNTQWKFPVTQTLQSESFLELSVRGDTVYLDQNVNFKGLRKLTVKARKFVSNGKTLTLEAPKVCASISGSNCQQLGKAYDMIDGQNGKDGVSSPSVEIYLHNLQGNANIISKASEGVKGENGGNGRSGQDNEYQSPNLNPESSCKSACGPLFGEKHYKGPAGPNGGNGYDGYKCGLSGNGGSAESVTLFSENVSGYVSLTQLSGEGGVPAEHGYAGRGGFGGPGGCGSECHNYLICVLIICWPQCIGKDQNCGSDRGSPGIPGQPGMDGFLYYPSPVMGEYGAVRQSALRQVASVKNWFVDEIDLLELIQRHAETLFQRNNNDEAYEVFSFLLSVSKEGSDLHNEVSVRMNMITEGFDYYGNTKNYAPDRDWADLSEKTDALLAEGQKLEDAYNDVMNEIQDISLVSNTMQLVITGVVNMADQELEYNQIDLENQKNLYVRSVWDIESTMGSEMQQINELLPLAIKMQMAADKAEMMKGFGGLIGGMAGCVTGLLFGNYASAIGGVRKVKKSLDQDPTCKTPTVDEASAAIDDKLDFGYAYDAIDPEDLDFTEMNASAVPLIMLSDLNKNKAALADELMCVLEDPASQYAVDLNRLINNYFTDAAARIGLINKIMNIDVQLKSISFNRDLLAQAQNAVDIAVESTEESLPMDVKKNFADLLFSLYQTQENLIMRAMYELSKAYQFESLWEFDILDKYSSTFSDQALVSNLGTLEGMVQLSYIRQELENDREFFKDKISSLAGPSSHVYTPFWEFNEVNNPDLIASLQTNGEFSMQLMVDPDDPSVGGCDSCYNARLLSFYVELSGAAQPSAVPSKIYIKVAHLGDSSFMLPLVNGQKAIELLQQTPEDVDAGHIMSFDLSNPILSVADPALAVDFLKTEHKFCENSDDFFGSKPCKSPYATYIIKIPRDKNQDCSLDPNYQVSGSNCKELDFTKFDTVRVYEKVKSWSGYPVQPSAEEMKRLISKSKEAE
ncbi:unnamed protein product [Clavelina lepadiformis]|uniref:Uncharacterized protein n=1 Tax=Clavelina lepadiformis TaxID=159417 RepID=A0ABP0GJH4_CLALP